MYCTILTGNVSRDNWLPLEKSYATAIKKCPEGLLQSFLLHSDENANLWHIITIWRSQAAYEKAHHLKQTETCTQLFCQAGTVPTRSTFSVGKSYQNSSQLIAA